MRALSITAPQITKEQEDREKANLTNDEKEAILDDLYGRNLQNVSEEVEGDEVDGNEENSSIIDRENEAYNNATTTRITHPQQQEEEELEAVEETTTNNNNYENRNDDNEDNNNEDNEDDNESVLDPSLLQEFVAAMDLIPMEDKVDYLHALIVCPELFETGECNLEFFIRCEDNNVELAAKRMALYWKMRKQIFGENRAFQPMTLCGAMNDDYNEWKSFSGLCRILPNDVKGRTVILYDRTHVAGLERITPYISLRICWYVVHLIIPQQSSRTNGVVILNVTRRKSARHLYHRKEAKLIFQSIHSILPVKVCAIHTCPAAVNLKFCVPVTKFVMSRYLRTRFIVHKPELADNELIYKLGTYGLRQDSLPNCVGGDLTNNPYWLEEQLIIEQEHEHEHELVVGQEEEQEEETNNTLRALSA